MKLLGIEQALNRPYGPEDNELQESFHEKLKMECLRANDTQRYLETRVTLQKVIPDYYECRLHSSLAHRAQGLSTRRRLRGCVYVESRD
jgi:transposase InsO family protein